MTLTTIAAIQIVLGLICIGAGGFLCWRELNIGIILFAIGGCLLAFGLSRIL